MTRFSERLVADLDALRQKGARVYPQHTNRASSIGWPCDRRHVLDRLHWQDKPAPDLGLLYIFNEGNIQERAITRDLIDAGYNVIEAQRDMFWQQYNLAAHFDFRLARDGQAPVLCEFKSMSPHIWDSINSVKDMLLSKWPHIRSYPVQMMVYLLLDARDETGLFLLKNKSTGRIKAIEVTLDYEAAEAVLQRCERINENVALGVLPDPIDNPDLCEKCDWYGSPRCDGGQAKDYGAGAEIVTDEEVISDLDRRAELAEAVKEYEALDSRIKARFRGHAQVLAGSYLITGTTQRRQYKATEAREIETWVTRIKDVTKARQTFGLIKGE